MKHSSDAYSATRPPTQAGPGPAVSPARVIVTPVSKPLIHPLSKRDVQRVLSVLPADSVSDLRSVSQLGDQTSASGAPVLATYRREGFLRLHAVSSLPWSLRRLPSAQVTDLIRFGARVEADSRISTVHWPPEALRLFFTVGVLLPGVARHRREQEGLHESSSVVRALDDGREIWQASDVALEQWRAFLANGG